MLNTNSFAKVLIFICLVAEVIPQENDSAVVRPSPRIVNGAFAARGQFPYQVSVRVNGEHSCGGALISQNYVVTAAHCVSSIPADFLQVQAGSLNRSTSGCTIQVERVISYPYYNFDNDIALLKLEQKINYTAEIQPIGLAAREVAIGEQVTISGWGRTSDGGPFSETLKYSRSLTTLSNEQCTRESGPLSYGVLCLAKQSYNKGFCDGDDGGPAVYRGVLIGIASYNTNGCGSSKPDGYTKVSYYRSWLIQNSDLGETTAG